MLQPLLFAFHRQAKIAYRFMYGLGIKRSALVVYAALYSFYMVDRGRSVALTTDNEICYADEIQLCWMKSAFSG